LKPHRRRFVLKRCLLSTELIPQGAALVAAGRLRRRGIEDGTRVHLLSSGPETLLLFATHPGGDPVEALRRMRRGRFALIGILALIAATAVGISFAARPYLPPSQAHIPSDD